jgi:O-antigen/teichoic acid export membrane protein
MTHTRDYVSNVVAQGAGRALSMISGFTVFIIFARMLGTEVLGHYAFVMAFILIAGSFAEFGITTALAKDLPNLRSSGPNEAAVFFGNYLLLRIAMASLVTLGAVTVSGYAQPHLQSLLLVSSFAIPFIGARFCETIYQIYERPIYSLYTSLFLAVTQLAVALVLLFHFKVGLYEYLYGFVGVQIAYFTLSMALAIKLLTPRFQPDRVVLASIATIATPIGLWTVFNIINSRADVFLINYFRSSEELGIYNAAYRLLDLVTVVAVTVATPLVPVLSRKFHANFEATRELCQTIFELTLIILLPAIFLTPHLAQLLVVTLYGEAYYPAAALLHYFSWVFVFLGVGYICMSINTAAGNIHYNWWSGLIAAILNILLNVTLIPTLGISGAAIAATITAGFMLIVSICFLRVSINQLIPIKRVAQIALSAAIPTLFLYFLGNDHPVVMSAVALVLYAAVLASLQLLPLEAVRTLLNTER